MTTEQPAPGWTRYRWTFDLPHLGESPARRVGFTVDVPPLVVDPDADTSSTIAQALQPVAVDLLRQLKEQVPIVDRPDGSGRREQADVVTRLATTALSELSAAYQNGIHLARMTEGATE